MFCIFDLICVFGQPQFAFYRFIPAIYNCLYTIFLGDAVIGITIWSQALVNSFIKDNYLHAYNKSCLFHNILI